MLANDLRIRREEGDPVNGTLVPPVNTKRKARHNVNKEAYGHNFLNTDTSGVQHVFEFL
ncbi:hypothetical protein NQZ68_021013 [Dissostichus eleginoides]|nr:hypothetical protein NQZ68_021013 [Dissostichus eleginoides]